MGWIGKLNNKGALMKLKAQIEWVRPFGAEVEVTIVPEGAPVVKVPSGRYMVDSSYFFALGLYPEYKDARDFGCPVDENNVSINL
jgi:hypothetical protein